MSVFIVVVSLVLAASAQQPTGSIEGYVSDPTGAVIPSAAVGATDKATGRIVSTTTNDSGFYVMRALLPGVYRMRFESPGFATRIVEDVSVSVGQATNGSTSLEVSGTQTVVEVNVAAETRVDTFRHQVDGVIHAREIDQLPLNARNFLELARLEPGVNVRDGNSIDPTKSNAYRTVGIAGRGGTGTRVQIDGIDVTDETVGTTTANISDESVSEFQVSHSSLDLSTSLTSSGAISVVTRSGGNEIHGSGFYFGRNQEMSAKQAPSQTGPNNPFHRHQVGFRAGGPFQKNKLFWFSSWERFYQADNFNTDPAKVTFFPQMAGNVGLPVGIRYATQRIDWNHSSNARFFYRFGHNWDSSTGGSGQSPYQNVDWTNVHALGMDITRPRATHSYRFGYVNFNNRIESQEFPQFRFLKTPDGVPYYLGVGQFGLGPNSLAPQQTYQDNFQNKYDGSYVRGDHILRFGMEVNRIVLGGFANFAGPLSINGTFTADANGTRDQVIRRGGNPQNPLEYPLEYFSTGPANGFFTIPGSHHLPHGGNFNTRIAWYAGDSWRALRNLTVNFGTRWEYDTGYFNKEEKDGVRRPAVIGLVHQPSLRAPKFPKDRFGPSFGFAFDPFKNGKTSIRGGFYLAYEMNIFNNTLFNEFALIPPGIGPDSYDVFNVAGPDGKPINVDGKHAGGDYSDLIGKPIKDVLGIISRVHIALNAAYANNKFDPKAGQTLFETAKGVTFGGIFPGDFKIPYSLQMNLGVQRELGQRNVLTVDYLRHRAIGLPLMMKDYEQRRDAAFLDVATARGRVADVLGGKTVDQWIAEHPGDTIAAFNLASDAVFTGRTTELTRARILTGGYSLYSALHAKLVGRLSGKMWFGKQLNYTVAYALGRSYATNGSDRAEFLSNTRNNRAINDKAYFGPTPFSNTHRLSAGIILDVPRGFRFNQLWTWNSRDPGTIFVPALGGVAGANRLFTTDLNGDGGTGGTPRDDLLPGVNYGQFGRKVKNVAQLNQVIARYNEAVAGKPTPHGQALIDAGIFTAAQLRSLKAVAPVIPRIPDNIPDPFASRNFNLDLRITRPIRFEKAFVSSLEIEPYFEAFNVFNRRGRGGIGGLDAGFGNLNFDYVGSNRLNDLASSRSFAFGPRILQLGFRVNF